LNLPISRSRLREILQNLPEKRVGVVGDFTLDAYWYADMMRSQLSRETPLYPRPITRETYSLGGAANVAWNLAAIGIGEVWAFSVLGQDWRGAILRGLLDEQGIHTESMISQPQRWTPFYGKVILTAAGRNSQEDARVDFMNVRPLDPEVEAGLLDNLAHNFPHLDALVVADYQPMGVMTARISEGLLQLVQNYSTLPVIVDSRERASNFRTLILKPNELEAAALFFPGQAPASVTLVDLSTAALDHTRRTGQPIFITLGEQGCLVGWQGQCQKLPAVPLSPPLDTVGAGDTFLASLAAGLASGASPLETAFLANLAAAVTVQQIGVTGTASPAQVLALYDSFCSRMQV
jgi:rfaE bifunctional protein kinase chain/domain